MLEFPWGSHRHSMETQLGGGAGAGGPWPAPLPPPSFEDIGFIAATSYLLSLGARGFINPHGGARRPGSAWIQKVDTPSTAACKIYSGTIVLRCVVEGRYHQVSFFTPKHQFLDFMRGSRQNGGKGCSWDPPFHAQESYDDSNSQQTSTNALTPNMD